MNNKDQNELIESIVDVARNSCNDGFNEHNAERESNIVVYNFVKKLRLTSSVKEELEKQNKKLLSVLKEAYRCSGERNCLTKPVLDEMLQVINEFEV